MQIRHAIAAVTVAAFALTLSACTGDPAPTESEQPTSTTPSATAQPSETPAPTATATPSPSPADPADVTIRDVTPGYNLDGVANSLRTGFPSFSEKSDDEIAIILNAGCDAIDLKGEPQAAADAIQTYGIEVYDAAFSVSAAIVLYCPEYVDMLKSTS